MVETLFLSMVMVGVNAVPITKLGVDIPCWVGYYNYKFVANVNITDVEDLYSFEFKLGWNTTYLDFVGVEITPPAEWDANYVIDKNATREDLGRYWLNVSALAPAPSFNGSMILAKLTFNVTIQPFEPEPDIWCCLDLYDTKLNDPEGLPISHEVYDGFLLIPVACPCIPRVCVKPQYYEATTLGENFTIDIYFELFNAYFNFASWKAKLGYNTTLLDVVKVEEGPFLGRFRTPDKRYFTASVNEEEGYVNMTGGILGTCATPFGSGTLAKVTFNATYVTTLPTIATCVLDLYDENFTDGAGQPLALPPRVDDGLYQAPHTKITGDINGDGKVNIKDIVIVALAFGSKPGDPNWNPIADVYEDGVIDIKDIVTVAIHYGETYP